MYSFGRCASRFLTSRSASFVSSSRTYTSFVAPPTQRLAQRTPAFSPQRRWATTESAKEGEVPISQLQATGPEEVENAIQSQVAEGTKTAPAEAGSDTAPAVAESAKLTEATEEALPTTKTQEKLVQEPADPTVSGQPLNYGVEGFQKKESIYVGNLFFDITESDLVKEFTRFGTVKQCRIIRDNRGLSKGFGYIDFADADGAEEAIRTMNMQLYEGRRMTVQYAARSSPPPRGEAREFKGPLNPPSKTLFIGNMSFEMTDRDLSSLFRGIRNVLDVRVAIDRRTGQPRGFAHADFIDVKSAMEALKVLQEKETYGRRLRVDYSFSSSQAPRNQSGSLRTHQSGPPAEPTEPTS